MDRKSLYRNSFINIHKSCMSIGSQNVAFHMDCPKLQGKLGAELGVKLITP